MCAYFYVQIYQVKKFTPTTLKWLYEPHRTFQNHYLSQIYTQLKDVFHWQNKRRKNAKEEKNN